MLKNTQTDKRWKDEIMTRGAENHRAWVDYIWRWGCLLTALANILGKFPDELNKLVREHLCYEYLHDPKTPENRASNLMLDKLKYKLGISIINNLGYQDYKQAYNVFWIARIIHRTGGGHYVNVLRKEDGLWKIFDVENGKEKVLRNKDITKLIKVEL